jgi:protein YibB
MEKTNPKLCLVTAFLDIGRDMWQTYPRSVSEYIVSFLPYLKLQHDIIVFMDDTHIQTLCNCIIDIAKSLPANITIIPINREWMSQHIYAYSKLEIEKKIMANSSFQKLIPEHRKGCPETYCAEYNILQHAKIDFVCYAIEKGLSSAEYFAWSDFGYFKNESMIMLEGCNKLNVSKFVLDKINFQTINEVDERDKDPIYTLMYAPEKIGGFFHMGSKDLLKVYRDLYHNVYDEMHRIGLVDDDQHMMLRCYFKRRDLFHLWNLGGWHNIYTTFCV